MAPSAEETAAAVEAAKQQLADAVKAHAEAVESAPPRKTPVVLRDLLTHIVSRFGNHPDLQVLLEEYDASLAPKEAPPATK